MQYVECVVTKSNLQLRVNGFTVGTYRPRSADTSPRRYRELNYGVRRMLGVVAMRRCRKAWQEESKLLADDVILPEKMTVIRVSQRSFRRLMHNYNPMLQPSY